MEMFLALRYCVTRGSVKVGGDGPLAIEVVTKLSSSCHSLRDLGRLKNISQASAASGGNEGLNADVSLLCLPRALGEEQLHMPALSCGKELVWV